MYRKFPPVSVGPFYFQKICLNRRNSGITFYVILNEGEILISAYQAVDSYVKCLIKLSIKQRVHLQHFNIIRHDKEWNSARDRTILIKRGRLPKRDRSRDAKHHPKDRNISYII